MCKKIGHGTNYAGQPRTLAEQAKVDVELIEEFQPIYFRAFPAHLKWHANVQTRLESSGTLTSSSAEDASSGAAGTTPKLSARQSLMIHREALLISSIEEDFSFGRRSSARS